MAWKKSDAEVSARRDVKIRAVNVICEIADARPMSAARGFRIDDGVLLYQMVAGFGSILQMAGAQATFRTAKGCKSRPQRAKDSFAYNESNFWEFMQHISRVDCLGSYMEIAWGWAVQIMKANPHSFPADHPTWHVYRKVRAAEIAKRAEFEQPGQPDF
jgi:hypothetical protein